MPMLESRSWNWRAWSWSNQASPVVGARGRFPNSSIEGRDFRACASRYGPRSCLPMAVKTRTQAGAGGRAAEQPSGHVVICGADELAFLIGEELQRLGETVAVIAANDSGKYMQRARALGIKTFAGDYRDEDVLGQAGVARARAFIAAEDDDVGNLHPPLAAHDLNPQ